MLAVKILLIPFKLILLILGYSLAVILKLVGFLISTLSYVCGWFTNLLGSIIVIGAILYTVCGFMNVLNIRTNEHWWVISVACGLVGAAISSMDIWADLFGDFLGDLGGDIIYGLSNMSFLGD